MPRKGRKKATLPTPDESIKDGEELQEYNSTKVSSSEDSNDRIESDTDISPHSDTDSSDSEGSNGSNDKIENIDLLKNLKKKKRLVHSEEESEIFEDVLTDEEEEVRGKVYNMRDYCNMIINKPMTNYASILYAIINFVAIIFSTVTYLISTLPDTYQIADISVSEHVVICFFTFDYLARIGLTRKHRLRWSLTGLNVVDFLAIFPYFIELIFEESARNIKSLVLLRVLRLFRVFRFIKMARYSRDVPIILRAVKRSYQGFVMSMFTVGLFATLWGSAFYYAETSDCYLDKNDNVWRYNSDDTQSAFQSIPHVLWFILVTMTTVGYGDNYPRTPLGKLVAGFTMICGVFTLALPITILASNFAMEYTKRDVEEKVQRRYKKRIEEVRQQPFIRPGERLNIVHKLLAQFQDDVIVVRERVEEFELLFEDLEVQVRGLKRHYRRREEVDKQKFRSK